MQKEVEKASSSTKKKQDGHTEYSAEAAAESAEPDGAAGKAAAQQGAKKGKKGKKKELFVFKEHQVLASPLMCLVVDNRGL